MTQTVQHGCFKSSEEVKQHIKEIAKVISEGADNMSIDPHRTASIRIIAEIDPQEVTTVSWHIQQIADARIGKERG